MRFARLAPVLWPVFAPMAAAESATDDCYNLDDLVRLCQVSEDALPVPVNQRPRQISWRVEKNSVSLTAMLIDKNGFAPITEESIEARYAQRPNNAALVIDNTPFQDRQALPANVTYENARTGKQMHQRAAYFDLGQKMLRVEAVSFETAYHADQGLASFFTSGVLSDPELGL